MDLSNLQFKKENWAPVRGLRQKYTDLVSYGMMANGELHIVYQNQGLNEVIYSVPSFNSPFLCVEHDEKIIVFDNDGMHLFNLNSQSIVLDFNFNDLQLLILYKSVVMLLTSSSDCIYIGFVVDNVTPPNAKEMYNFGNGVKIIHCQIDNTVKNHMLEGVNETFNKKVFAFNNGRLTYNDIEIDNMVFVDDVVSTDFWMIGLINKQCTYVLCDEAEDVPFQTTVQDMRTLTASILRYTALWHVTGQLGVQATSAGVKFGKLNTTMDAVVDGVTLNEHYTCVNEYTPICSQSMRTLIENAVIDMSSGDCAVLNLCDKNRVVRFTPAVVDDMDGKLRALVVDVNQQTLLHNLPQIDIKCLLMVVDDNVQTEVVSGDCHFVDPQTMQGTITEDGNGVLLYICDVRWAINENNEWTNTTMFNNVQVKLSDYVEDNSSFVTDVDDPRYGTRWSFVYLDKNGMTSGDMPIDTVAATLFKNTPHVLRMTTAGDLNVYDLTMLMDKKTDISNVVVDWSVGFADGVLIHTNDKQTLFINVDGHASNVVADEQLVVTKPFVTQDNELFTIIDDRITPLMLINNELRCATGAYCYVKPTNTVVNIMRGENGVYVLTATPEHIIMLEKLMPGGVC